MGAAFTQDADQGVKAWMVDMIAGGDKEGYESQAQATLYFDVRDRLDKIGVPTTVNHSDHDRTVPVAAGEALANAVPGATLHVVAGEGHYAIVQVPEKINPLLADGLGIPRDLVPRR